MGDERCERTLLLNDEETLKGLVKTVGTIVGNVVREPSNGKYRKLRRDSKALSRVLSLPGGRELLTHVGFRPVDEIPPAIELKAKAGDEDRLAQILRWLEALRYEKEAPAFVLAITVPPGRQVVAGFAAHETVRDVCDYVATYFGKDLVMTAKDDRGKDRKFCEASSDLSSTLADANLAPRAKVTRAAVKFVPADPSRAISAAERAAEDARLRGLERERREKRERKDRDDKIRHDKVQRQRDQLLQRNAALRNYEDDREEKTERLARERRNRATAATKEASSPAASTTTGTPTKKKKKQQLVHDSTWRADSTSLVGGATPTTDDDDDKDDD